MPYFLNPSSDYWQIALTGLEDAGFSEKLVILKAALALMGDEAPSCEQHIRQEQLASLLRQNEWLFRIQDDHYSQSKEHYRCC